MVASWGLISFGSGVEFIGVSLFRPMSSEGARSIIRQVGPAARTCPVLSKEWPYDGENGDMTEEYRLKNTGLGAAAPHHRFKVRVNRDVGRRVDEERKIGFEMGPESPV
jgi:hypothetical protein